MAVKLANSSKTTEIKYGSKVIANSTKITEVKQGSTVIANSPKITEIKEGRPKLYDEKEKFYFRIVKNS